MDRYYTTGAPQKPETVENVTEDEKQEWLTTKPEIRPDRPPAQWWYHIFNLGEVLEVGERRRVCWRETFFDKDRTLKPHLGLVVPDAMESLSLAMRLPERHRHRSALARIIADPLGRRDVIDEWECSPDGDGWCIQPFTNLTAKLEYGIYFHELQLYG